MVKVDIISVMKAKKQWYFTPSGWFRDSSEIDGLPREIYKEYLDFCIESYIDDIDLDYFYNLYVKYIQKNQYNGKKYLSEKGFKNHLKSLGLKTYSLIDSESMMKEYVCVDMSLYEN